MKRQRTDQGGRQGGGGGGGGWERKERREGGGGGGGGGQQQQQANDAWAAKLQPAALRASQGKNAVPYTVTLAIPGSILRTAITRELKTYMVGQIARAVVMHEVDEIVVYVDSAAEASAPDPDKTPSVFFCRVLQYLECPPYLRRDLFPHHNDLSNVGLLPLLETPHHMRAGDVSLYREGVVVADKLTPDGCFVNVGLSAEVFLPRPLKPGTRVTLKLDEPEAGAGAGGGGRDKQRAAVALSGAAVKPSEPRELHGLYWGYQTRLAKGGLSEVFSGCPFAGGYDVMIGNSDKGEQLLEKALGAAGGTGKASVVKSGFKHLLVVFGGVGGIEACVDADEKLTTKGKDADTLFDQWLNLCPAQGCKQVRTEEAVLVGLAKLMPLIKDAWRR